MAKYFKYSIEQFKKDAKKNGNGIYVIYSDHLSCDAWVMFAVVNGDILQESHPTCWQTRNYYGDGSPLGGYYDLLKLCESFPDLTIYISNIAYYTFPSKWMHHSWLDKEESIYKRDGFKYQVFDIEASAEEDPKKSWLDKE